MPGYNLDQVYVLRQTFRPNEPLREAFAKLVSTGTEGSRRFSLYGTDERVLEIADSQSQDFEIQRREADASLQSKANTHLFLDGEVVAHGHKVRGHGTIALRLLLQPQNTVAYAGIRDSLDLIEAGRRGHTPGFDGAMLYATIPTEQLRPLPEVKERLAELNRALGDAATRQLYRVMPSSNHVGRAVPRASREPLEVARDESEADEYTESRAS